MHSLIWNEFLTLVDLYSSLCNYLEIDLNAGKKSPSCEIPFPRADISTQDRANFWGCTFDFGLWSKTILLKCVFAQRVRINAYLILLLYEDGLFKY